MTKQQLISIIREETKAVFSERKKPKKKKPKTDFSLEKKRGLAGWFDRKGGGWVDCNTCRKDKKTGKKKCKPCGRSGGEKRSKHPACRPTPSACGSRGNWGKKSKGGKKG
tara:strand:- start:1814 stop:2143 length:330 start_codon:yes stop_codon:yes gene_type:complete